MKWTDAEIEELCKAYRDAPASDMIQLDRLAKLFNRHKTNVCRKARALGLTDMRRAKSAQMAISQRESVFATKEERNAATGKRIKAYIAEHGHPRGSLGMKHSQETKAIIAEKSKAMWDDPNSRQNSQENRQRLSDLMIERVKRGDMAEGYSRTRGGRRDDLGGKYFRSAWEANYARYLNWLKSNGDIADWEYEARTFVFESIKRGTRAYTPDFLVKFTNGSHEWHEVKGWMDAKSKTRLSRMARYYPDEKVVVVGSEWFRAANRGPLPGIIAHWERGSVR